MKNRNTPKPPRDPLTIEGDKVRGEAARRADDAAKRVRTAVEVVKKQVRSDEPGRWTSRRADLLANQPNSRVLVEWIDNAILCWTLCIADSVESCAHLIRRGTDSQISALASARIALDTASQLAYLLGSEGDDDSMLLIRAALLAWQDNDDEQSMFRWAQKINLAVPEDSSHFRKLTAATEGMGYTIQRNKHTKRVNLLIDAKGAEHRLPTATRMTSDMEKEQTGEAQAAWRITSGSSHGRPWLVTYELNNPDDYPGIAARTATTAAISAASVALAHLGDIFGDARLAGSGRYLNETAQRLGTPPTPYRRPFFLLS